MAIVVPSIGATALLDALLKGSTPWVHLYVNDVVLDADTTLADLIEANWPDYVPQKATGWTPALWTVDRAESASDPLLWLYGVAVSFTDVYGYFVTDKKTGPLLWCEARPDGPVRLQIASDEVEVWPRLTLRQDPQPE